MAEFFQHILTYQFALVFVATLICFVAYGYPGYTTRTTNGFAWLMWLIAGVICLAVTIKIAFGL